MRPADDSVRRIAFRLLAGTAVISGAVAGLIAWVRP
jgi:hypothetical protein